MTDLWLGSTFFFGINAYMANDWEFGLADVRVRKQWKGNASSVDPSSWKTSQGSVF
jgi:hypothetical protein